MVPQGHRQTQDIQHSKDKWPSILKESMPREKKRGGGENYIRFPKSKEI